MPLDLAARAIQAMHDEGFATELPPAAMEQLRALPTDTPGANVRDLRGLLWSSIDNPDSRDLDQVEYAEPSAGGNIRVWVGVADVDHLVPARTALDAHASRSTTSVYTGVATFPMLPEMLSTDRTSLNPGQNRLALVAEMEISPQGTIVAESVYTALLCNHAKLNYESVGAWLEGASPPPEAVANVPGLQEQIRLQNAAAERLANQRCENGALELETVEVRPVLGPDGQVTGLTTPPRNRAHLLIENLMIAANSVAVRFLTSRGFPALERVVRPPERWPRIVDLAKTFGADLPPSPNASALAAFLAEQKEASPATFADLSLAVVKLLGPGEYILAKPGKFIGHFGLATPLYTHFTAPNRRYPDLLLQRLVKAALLDEPPPYDAGELDFWATHCTEREDAARKVERRVRKIAAGSFLAHYIGETFRAIVTFRGRKGVFVRVLSDPANGVEGRIIAGEAGLDVGDTVTVRLVDTDPVRGFIDFTRVFV